MYEEDFTTDADLDAISAAEQELIEMADAGLHAHGIEIPDEEISGPVEREQQEKFDGLRAAMSRSEKRKPTTDLPRLPKKFKLNESGEMSKKDRAVVIYNKMSGAARKDILAVFIADLSMSKAVASTYYQNIKSGKWS